MSNCNRFFVELQVMEKIDFTLDIESIFSNIIVLTFIGK